MLNRPKIKEWSNSEAPDKPGCYKNTYSGYIEVWSDAYNAAGALKLLFKSKIDLPTYYLIDGLDELTGVWDGRLVIDFEHNTIH